MQPNKAIVGANAFAHESGIHQDGVLKSRETYEIMRAEDVGWSTNKLVLGKLSGRNAFKQRLKELGIELESEEALNAAFVRFKDLADKKSEIFDEDLQMLVSDEAVTQEKEHFQLVSMMAHSETGETPMAQHRDGRGRRRAQGRSRRAAARWTRPSRPSSRSSSSGAELQLYSVNNITSGTDCAGRGHGAAEEGTAASSTAQGADTDIVVASAKAYINALNKLHSKLERAHPQV